MTREINTERRDFLKKSAVAGVIATGGLAFGLGGGPKEAEARPVPEKWDEEFDVIVVGSGFAGLAAAISAKESGAEKVVILEKMPVSGGNSTINGGLLAVVNSQLQLKEGVKDSVELYMNDLLKAGRGLNHVDLIKIVAMKGQDLPEWCSERGVEWNPKLEHLGGHSVARTYLTTVSSGSGIVRPLTKYYQEQLGGILKTGVKLVGVIRDEAETEEAPGKILGVEVQDGYKFNYKSTDGDLNNTSGTKKYYRAKKGVVIATGGFSQDPFFRGAQDPNLAKPTNQLDSTNQPGATAETIEELLKLGAVPVHLSWIQSGPWASPNEKGFGVGSSYQIAAGFRFGIMIDKTTGKRFMNELADRRTRALAMFKVIGDPSKPNYPFTVADSQEGVLAAQTLDKCLERDVVLKFETLDAIAEHFNVPVEPFKQQIKEYNDAVNAKTDEQFGKPIDKVMKPIEKAPFYVMEGVPKVHHTMGGVMINTEGKVIEGSTQKPIPGLYAAGEVVGGPHGASRLGSCAIPDCLVFGRICGSNVVKEKEK
ncbi:flavocytochrome c [Desulfofustis glycolicus]|uniref:Flavocytochrome c n=1 Tax=Desulfofustis glycolicus DSM 9705 TaxID=1121409 RepID=A0A1M5XAD2_9BACT|nr:flavocytochrome c [Desulfofustis glycolicus]SHH96679.1 flavocytochrome c [Desulfofustis glycolicus DSM 9705]